MRKFKIIFIIIIILVIAGFLFWKLGNRSVEVKKENQKQEEPTAENGISPITGEKCANYNRRSIAVMLATDPVTRPLSGISQADMVIDMLVTNTITRLMAVYGCETPEEIGSVRSARHDYIPLALGLDAIYAHWGGSHFAYDQLNKNIINNIDAMINPYNAYWQKSEIPMPHNGFTSLERLINAADKLGYRLTNNFTGYPHLKNAKPGTQAANARLSIGYSGHFAVSYEYNKNENIYRRWRDNQREIDKNNGNQVEASVVIIMKAESRMIEPPNYNEVDVEGEGNAIIYQNGEEIKGFWKKEGTYSKSKLTFLDLNNKEIQFVPGKIWLEIVEPTTEIVWQPI